MQKIIPAVSRQQIKDELTQDVFLWPTNKAGNELYLTNAQNAPNIMQEIGRLRELSFRAAGGGTGKSTDIDEYDLAKNGFQQLIVWDPEDEEIIAGYRLMFCENSDKDSDGNLKSATAHLFEFSPNFKENYLPKTIELGRSFVQPKYQSGASSRKGLFSMDNLWDGLGAVITLNPDVKYLFGKVTMYPSFQREARNMILAFLKVFFPDKNNLVWPHHPIVSNEELQPFFHHFENLNYKEAHAKLSKMVRERGETIPPLINTYMNISETMKTFGTAENTDFGQVEETGILVTVADIFPDKKERHIQSFENR